MGVPHPNQCLQKNRASVYEGKRYFRWGGDAYDILESL